MTRKQRSAQLTKQRRKAKGSNQMWRVRTVFYRSSLVTP